MARQFIFIIFLLLFSCKEKNHSLSDRRITLEIVKTGKIKNTKQLNYVPWTVRMDKFNPNILNYSEADKQGIYQFDIEADSVINYFEFDLKGPEGIGNLWGFDQDLSGNFILSSIYNNRFIIANTSGEILSRIFYPKEFEGTTFYPAWLYTHHNTSFIEIDSFRILQNELWGTSYDEIRTQSEGKPMFVKLMGGKLSSTNLNYPLEMFEDHANSMGRFTFDHNDKNGTTYVSFKQSHIVMKVNWRDGSVLKKSVKSNYFTEFVDSKRDYLTPIHMNILCFNYDNIYYDQYRDLIYRIVKKDSHEQYDPNKSYGRYDGMYYNDGAVMVMTPEFELLGEIDIPDDENYVLHSFTVTDKGILICKNNPLGDLDEDYFQYDIFKVIME